MALADQTHQNKRQPIRPEGGNDSPDLLSRGSATSSTEGIKPGTPTKKKCIALYGHNQQSQWCKQCQGKKKCNRVQIPTVQDKQNTEVTNPYNYSSKTAGPHQDAATLTDKQVDTNHQPTTAPALRLYLTLPKTMTETTLQEQEGAPILLFTNYIKPANKRKPGYKILIRFQSKHFHGIMEKLQFVPMIGNNQPPTALHHLENWPGYIATVQEYESKVMLCPNVARGIIKINASLEPSTTPSL